MSIQYVQDDTGKTTAVLVPIEEWKLITENNPNVSKAAKTVIKKRKASDFKGILSSGIADALHQHVSQSREQWD